MRRALLAGVAAIAVVTLPLGAAEAQEFDWTGFYAGLFGGFLDGDVNLNSGAGGGEEQVIGLLSEPQISDGYGLYSGSMEGGIAGFLWGYNFKPLDLWPNSNVIFGIDADFGLTGANGQIASYGGGPGQDDASFDLVDGSYDILQNQFEYSLEWLAHVRARFGTPIGNVFPFAAVGVALGDFSLTGSDYFGCYSWTDSKVLTGLSIGGGIETYLNSHAIVRIEVIYDDFGSQTFGDGVKVNFSSWTARGAMIFPFN